MVGCQGECKNTIRRNWNIPQRRTIDLYRNKLVGEEMIAAQVRIAARRTTGEICTQAADEIQLAYPAIRTEPHIPRRVAGEVIDPIAS